MARTPPTQVGKMRENLTLGTGASTYALTQPNDLGGSPLTMATDDFVKLSIMFVNTNPAVSNLSGWTQIPSSFDTVNTRKFGTWYRRRLAGDPSSYSTPTFTSTGGGGNADANQVIVRGVDWAQPVVAGTVYKRPSSITTMDAPSISVGDGSIAFTEAWEASNAVETADTETATSGWTRAQGFGTQAVASTLIEHVTSWYQQFPTATTTGTMTLTFPQTGANGAAQQFAVQGPLNANFSDNAALSGTGTFSATGNPAFATGATLSGVGTFTVTAVPKFTGSASMSSTGTFTAVTAPPAFSSAANMSGSSTLSATTKPSFPATASMSGTGTLSVTTKPAFSVGASISGTSTLTAVVKPVVSVAASLSGASTFSAIGKPAFAVAASLNGTSTLSAIGSGSSNPVDTATLSGSSTLSAIGIPKFSSVASLSGVSTLSATVVPKFTASPSLSGAGTLSATGIPSVNYSASAALSSSGTLSGAGVPRFISVAALNGAGTLVVGAVPKFATSAALSGIGILTAFGSAGSNTPPLDIRNSSWLGPRAVLDKSAIYVPWNGPSIDIPQSKMETTKWVGAGIGG